jgi:methanogenic corrinoid protein MtbC1
MVDSSAKRDLVAWPAEERARPARIAIDLREILVRAIRQIMFTRDTGLETSLRRSGLSGDTASGKAVRALLDDVEEMCMAMADPVAGLSSQRFLSLLNALEIDHFHRLALLESLAHEIGRKWECDDASFIQVTIAVSRLQATMRALAPDHPSRIGSRNAGRILLLAPVGEQHIFPLAMLEEMFCARGWETRLLVPERESELARAVSGSRWDVVCLSWLNSEIESRALSAVRAIRNRLPRGRGLLLAGGYAALAREELLFQNGVDEVVSTGYLGIAVAERFLSSKVGKARFLNHRLPNPN